MKSVIQAVTKLSIIALVISFPFGIYASDHVEGLTCEGKKQAIEVGIEQAKNHNNIHKVEGLQKILKDIKNHCLNKDLEEKYKKKIQEKTDKVAKRTQELAQAKTKGDKQKITKQQIKLADAEQELNEVKAELAKFYKELEANKPTNSLIH
ncbi:hypothetical protein A9G34_00600 [Gilliamella sp. Choc4-2]|jgi:valyl-tRNA synthetase|uniref:DUF1090 domain-containing protein n=1 Tax=unclassified Gilliamella TaxID=2685620 RepID=UPI0004DD6CB4|nr:DUF1090 domain-containing protein [Gilliamella apicola]KFA59349.1 Periplasmic protein YqjC [Gilliamella apicola]OCG32633.1 hypothetical protein A9G33_03350 [Gilliamella apicola]OCG46399.1 hypothetical protein A9G34_00600 [Gilliamella apicola]OCG53753.1 hypothetical protein A9G36_09580 [Gilliamella apicola]OCG64297.1 hypothetical protein A9G48_03425 [Gilliamella apicola]